MTPEERAAAVDKLGIEVIDGTRFRCKTCGNVYTPRRQTSPRDMWWICGKKGCNLMPVPHGLNIPAKPKDMQ